MNGRTFPTHGAGSNANAGGVRRHWPGSEAFDDRERSEASVAGPLGEHRGRGRCPHLDPACLRGAVGDRRERGRELRIEGGTAGSGTAPTSTSCAAFATAAGDESFRIGHRRSFEVRLVSAFDRVHRVVHRALHHRQVEVGDGRTLSRGADDGRLGVGIPFDHHVGRRRVDRTGRRRNRGKHQSPQHGRTAEDHGHSRPDVSRGSSS